MPNDDQLADLERLSKELDARILIWEAQPPRDAMELTEALGLQSVVFEPRASQGSRDNLFDAYEQAVSSLSEAVSQSAE
jgi:zinc transport system substrate-binding protein